MDEKDLKIQALLEEIAILKGINAEQAMQIDKLMLRILELEKRLGKNSNNSSKPPFLIDQKHPAYRLSNNDDKA